MKVRFGCSSYANFTAITTTWTLGSRDLTSITHGARASVPLLHNGMVPIGMSEQLPYCISANQWGGVIWGAGKPHGLLPRLSQIRRRRRRSATSKARKPPALKPHGVLLRALSLTWTHI